MSRQWDRRSFQRGGRTGWHPPRNGSQIDGATIRTVLLAAALLGLGYATIEQPRSSLSAAGVAVVDSPDITIIDGDTFRYHGEKIRIADIDAPETHPPRCAREAELGAAATQRMEALLEAGPFELFPGGDGRDEDVYGRKLRIVSRNGQSLGETLVAEGLAHPWVGHKLPWCG